MIIFILLISITGIAEPTLSWIKIEVNRQDIFVDRWLREKLSGDWTGAEQFIHDVAIVYRDSDGLHLESIINRKGQHLLPYSREKISIFALSNDIVELHQGDSMYLYNTRTDQLSDLGSIKLIATDSYTEGINEPLFLAFHNGFYGYVDGSAQCIIPFCWKDAGPFSEGLAFVSNDTFTGFIDVKGKRTIDSNGKWFSASPFKEGFSVVMINDAVTGIINTKGEIITTLKPYHDGYIDQFLHDGFLLVSDGEHHYFIDPQGNMLAGKYWRDARCFSNGYAAVMNDDNVWGFIDTKGQMVIPYRYDAVDWYYEHYAGFDENDRTWVFIHNTQALINTKGDQLTTQPMLFCPEYSVNTENRLSSAYVVYDEAKKKYGVINTQGDIVYPLTYKQIEVLQGDILKLYTDVKIIFGDAQGNIFFCVPTE